VLLLAAEMLVAASGGSLRRRLDVDVNGIF
jgi:hypothetical protein